MPNKQSFQFKYFLYYAEACKELTCRCWRGGKAFATVCQIWLPGFELQTFLTRSIESVHLKTTINFRIAEPCS